MFLTKKLDFYKEKEFVAKIQTVPSCFFAMDKFSLQSDGFSIKNLIDDTIPLYLQEKTSLTDDGGIVFSGSNAAGFSSGQKLSGYTILCYLDADLNKVECDIIGSGTTSGGDLLLMFYNRTLRGHQWPSGGGAFILDATSQGGKFIGQRYDGATTPQKFDIIKNGVPNKTQESNVISQKINPYFCIGGRNVGYHGRFKGTIYGVRLYNKPLSDSEISKEFEDMEKRATM